MIPTVQGKHTRRPILTNQPILIVKRQTNNVISSRQRAVCSSDHCATHSAVAEPRDRLIQHDTLATGWATRRARSRDMMQTLK